MALFPNSMSDLWSKLAILKIFNRCAEIPEAVRDLFLRLNFASWIAITIEV